MYECCNAGAGIKTRLFSELYGCVLCLMSVFYVLSLWCNRGWWWWWWWCMTGVSDDWWCVARWQAPQTTSSIVIPPVGTWTIVSAPHWTPSVWRTPPMRPAFWRVWVRYQWTAQLTLVERSVQHLCSRRPRGYRHRHESDQATSTRPHPTWLWMTWERQWRSCRPRRPSIIWLFMLSTRTHESINGPGFPRVLETRRKSRNFLNFIF